MTIKLGDKAKDTITGFTGIVMGRYEYLNGCVRLGLRPDYLDKDRKPIEEHIFDIEQCVLVKAAPPRIVKPAGGPRPAPAQRPSPAR